MDLYDAVAFGCPAMGAEVLKESEFQPMFDDCAAKLEGKKIALFGSLGWGGGEWMRQWETQCRELGAVLACDSVTCANQPEEDTLGACMNLGAACVFFIRDGLNRKLERAFTGFAAGVMVAASVWSLLIPAMEQSARLGKYAFFPAFAGFWAGILFLLLLDHVIPHLHRETDESEGPEIPLSRTAKMVLAVTLHNIPEGMAVGVVYAGILAAGTEASSAGITPAGALALSLGIAIQNFPEGAIISLPLRAEGLKDSKAFLYGVLSGVVEPAGGFLTILAVRYVTPFLPYFLSFAAGAMLYVVVEELIPEMGRGEHSHIGTLSFAAGFSLMMVLDVAL